MTRHTTYKTVPYALRLVAAIIVLFVLLGVILYLARPASTERVPAKGTLHLVAAENFWGNIASQLGGSHVQVTSIITDPNADPHLYESNAQDASAIASADIVIINGLGYDDFMMKLVNASRIDKHQVLTAAAVLGAPQGSNQHVWYDIPRIPEVASAITTRYVASDPAHKADYERNLAAFDQSLQPLTATIAQIKQRFAVTPVAYTEPVPGYLLSAAGLAVKTPSGFAKSIEDGDDPSPADTNAMDILVTSRAIKVLLYNAQATSPVTDHVKRLAQSAGIPVIGVTETLPANEKTYQSWQENQLHALLVALQT